MEPSVDLTMDSEPWASEGLESSPEIAKPSYSSSAFLWQVKLMRIASSIMDAVYDLSGSSRRDIDLVKVTKLQ